MGIPKPIHTANIHNTTNSLSNQASQTLDRLLHHPASNNILMAEGRRSEVMQRKHTTLVLVPTLP
jgi:hypothetical protein